MLLLFGMFFAASILFLFRRKPRGFKISKRESHYGKDTRINQYASSNTDKLNNDDSDDELLNHFGPNNK